jgi:multidrug resistance efflux pump
MTASPPRTGPESRSASSSAPAAEPGIRPKDQPSPADLAPPPTVARPPATTRSSSLSPRRRRLVWLIPILAAIGGLGLMIGYRFWYESANFVMTENAQVAGDLVYLGSSNAGRLIDTRVEVGDSVREGQELAVVSIPQQIGSVPFSSTPVLGETGTRDTLTSVRASLTGVVVARLGSPGGTVAAGQPIYALVDPTRVWIRANIEEDKVGRVERGQDVEVHVDALNQTLFGSIQAVTPASAATFSLLPAQNTSGNFTKVTQLVPVRIALNTDGKTLLLGTSVEVKIHTSHSSGWLPWQQ